MLNLPTGSGSVGGGGGGGGGVGGGAETNYIIVTVVLNSLRIVQVLFRLTKYPQTGYDIATSID